MDAEYDRLMGQALHHRHCFKGLDGLLELVGGTLLLFVAPARIRDIAVLATQPELTEDPNVFIANHILQGSPG